MSKRTIPTLEGDNLEFDAPAKKLMTIGIIVGLLGLGSSFALGASRGDHLAAMLHSYLVAFAYFLAIALGALFFVTSQFLFRAGWSVLIRRVAEIIAATLPVFALLSLVIIIPTAMGNHHLYEWVDHELVARDPLLQHKEPYLNTPFFLIRMAVYFVFWGFLSWFFLGNSTRQDETGDWKLTRRMEILSAPGTLLYALTITFAAVDFLMALMPHWFSTIIGVYYFAASFGSGMAFLILAVRYLQSTGRLKTVNEEHFQDMGKLMFAFIVFWAYIAFSQYMLIWYANMPEGTQFYEVRQEGAWVSWSVGLLLIHFVIPFLGVMSRHVKRNRTGLLFWASWMLFAHWWDMIYLVKPSYAHHHHPGSLSLDVLDLTCMLGVGGFFVFAIGFVGRGRKLVPMKDPRLSESLAFENV